MNFIQNLTNNWHFMRWLRLAFALFLFEQAYETKEYFLVVFGGFFLLQAIFNWGCSPNGCSIPKK
ncbi:MAG: hypothetical protein FGM16_03035 [Flavobacterium sp.]|nr:hypothetical protein [Flavobacterium sp.]